MIQLDFRSRSWTKRPTPTLSVVKNPTTTPTPAKHLRPLKTPTPQPWDDEVSKNIIERTTAEQKDTENSEN